MVLVQRGDAPGANGLQIEAVLVCVENTVKLRMIATNQSDKTLDKFLIKFAPNLYVTRFLTLLTWISNFVDPNFVIPNFTNPTNSVIPNVAFV